MRALSLWQPWASLWLTSYKVHETRRWATRHRGWTLVHAAQRMEFALSDEVIDILTNEWGGHWENDLPRGAILGAVNVVDCVVIGPKLLESISPDDRACGKYLPGRWAWRRREFVPLEQPIPYRGAQGFFGVPDSLLPPAFLERLAA